MKTRFDPVIADSPELRAKLDAEVDNTGLKRIGGSFLYIRGTFSKNAAISVPADILIHDEVDFSNQEVMMHWHGANEFLDATVIGMNAQHHRRRGFFGDYLFAIPEENVLLVLDRTGKPVPYAGASGRTLRGWLARAGFDEGTLHGRFYLTSLTKCFPGPSASGKGDRAPSAAEVALCRAHLDRELAKEVDEDPDE